MVAETPPIFLDMNLTISSFQFFSDNVINALHTREQIMADI